MMQRSSSITSTSATSTTTITWRRARGHQQQQQHRHHHHQKVHSSSSNNDNDGVGGEIIKVVLKVPDMMCEGCAESVTNALKESNDSTTREISIDLETKLVTVSVGGCASAVEAMGKIPELVNALKENGFDAEPVFD